MAWTRRGVWRYGREIRQRGQSGLAGRDGIVEGLKLRLEGRQLGGAILLRESVGERVNGRSDRIRRRGGVHGLRLPRTVLWLGGDDGQAVLAPVQQPGLGVVVPV